MGSNKLSYGSSSCISTIGVDTVKSGGDLKNYNTSFNLCRPIINFLATTVYLVKKSDLKIEEFQVKTMTESEEIRKLSR